MIVTVRSIRIPAMSTIGRGFGVTQDGLVVRFVGDHRPMRHLGEELLRRAEHGEEAPMVELEDWQIVGIDREEE